MGALVAFEVFAPASIFQCEVERQLGDEFEAFSNCLGLYEVSHIGNSYFFLKLNTYLGFPGVLVRINNCLNVTIGEI